MDKLLVAAGIAIIIYVMWKDWAKEATLQKEKEDGRLLLDELADARKEVQVLLEQLETASEKIVDEISYGLEEIKIQVSSAIEKPDDGEYAGINNGGKATAVRVLKKTRPVNSSKQELANPSNRRNQSNINPVSLTSVKAASTKKKREAANERVISSGKEPHEKNVSPKHQMVYAMADMGHTEEDIAKQMKIGKGEVSLLLQLRRKGE